MPRLSVPGLKVTVRTCGPLGRVAEGRRTRSPARGFIFALSHARAGGIRLRARSVAATIAVLLALTVPAISAGPLQGEPVLRPDTSWIEEPWGFRHASLALPTNDHPTIMSMEGYDGASRPEPNAYLRMDDGELMALRITFGAGPRGDYASVQASIRGTECSGGQFNLYDRRHAWDGYQIVEWIAQQDWSNGKVGMFGSSYPGQTAYWVATTQPPHLAAISANLLHSDIYRDIFMPGGVQNNLFPVFWTYGMGVAGPHRLPVGAIDERTFTRDEICLQNQASRYSAGDLPPPSDEPALKIAEGTDNMWYASHAALNYADLIKIPYYQQGNWQDEQTGPRGVVLWDHIKPDLRLIRDADGDPRIVEPKRLVVGSGDHGQGGYAERERWAWFDIWLLGMPDVEGLLEDRVVNHFEAQEDGSAAATVSGDQWPLEQTQWTELSLHGDGTIDSLPPAGEEQDVSYVSGEGRQSWFTYTGDTGADVLMMPGLPDAAAYRTAPLAEDLVIAGPITLTLSASLSGTDTDFFVSLADVWPDGSISFIQRGMLKASHNAIDPLRSYYNDEGDMVQPWRPHTNPQPVTPLDVNEYRIEIFPAGHVFRAGHRLLVQVHTPPAVDSLWGYTATQHQPGVVTIHHGAATPATLLLPVVEPDGPIAPATSCAVPAGFPCIQPGEPEVPPDAPRSPL